MIDYASVLRGKSVCVVGRADYLYDKIYGDFIDSHDVVVRVNLPRPQRKNEPVIKYKLYRESWDYKQSFVDSKYWENIGRRTDVFAIANPTYIESAKLWLPGFIDAGGMVVRYIESFVPLRIQDNMDMIDKSGNLSIIDLMNYKSQKWHYKSIEKKLRTGNQEYLPTSGIWAIDDLRNQSLASLSIFGFTLNHHNNEPGNCYYKHPPDHRYHDIWIDLLLMYHAIGYDFRIRPDAELRETIDRRMAILSKMDRTIKGI